MEKEVTVPHLLTEEPKDLRVQEVEKLEADIRAQEAVLNQKTKDLQAEWALHQQARRTLVMKAVTAIKLPEIELDAFVSVFSKVPGAKDFGTQILNNLHGQVDSDQLANKLIRMGLL